MDNLQHIDELLRSSASSSANSYEVDASDWLVVEKKLRYRKNRIYAVWFFLALILVSSTVVIFKNTKEGVSNINENTTITSSNDFKFEDESQDLITLPKAFEHSEKIEHNLESNSIKNNSQSVSKPIDLKNRIIDIEDEKTEGEYEFYNNNIVIEAQKSLSAKIALNNNWPLFNSSFPSIPLINVGFPGPMNSKQLKIGSYKNVGYWEAGISFTPSISGKFISENSQLAGLINRSYYGNVLNSEKSSFSNSAGMNIQYHLPSGLFIVSGLFISQRAEYINYNYTITEYPRVNNNTIESYNPLTPAAYVNVKYNGSNSYHFVELPLNIGYKRDISSKFELRGQMGMSYLHLFDLNGVKADYTTLEVKNLNDYTYNQGSVAANAKLGVYLNKPRFTLGAEPIFNYNITSISNENTAIKVKPYSYGFNISTNYKFKN